MMPLGQILSTAAAAITYAVAGWLFISHIIRDVRAARKDKR